MSGTNTVGLVDYEQNFSASAQFLNELKLNWAEMAPAFWDKTRKKPGIPNKFS